MKMMMITVATLYWVLSNEKHHCCVYFAQPSLILFTNTFHKYKEKLNGSENENDQNNGN